MTERDREAAKRLFANLDDGSLFDDFEELPDQDPVCRALDVMDHFDAKMAEMGLDLDTARSDYGRVMLARLGVDPEEVLSHAVL